MTSAQLQNTHSFHPLIEEWFHNKYGEPTAVQSQSWPRIANGENLVVSAPTGSGKTLTAFLALIDQFARNDLESGAIRVVYVSPLKALNNDIQRNLLEPLGELRATFARSGYPFPSIQVQTRSGDTPQSVRQRMLRQPPEILVTTPESLMFMLTARRSQDLFDHVETVILDEIHALVENRRGAMLMACLERIVDMSGEFQRIALSATVRPMSTIVKYVAGYDHHGQPRIVDSIDVRGAKRLELSVHLPKKAIEAYEQGQPIWEHLISEFNTAIQTNRSTLVFVGSRRMAEKITHDVNREAESVLAYSHHGSLSREIREEVESRLKRGELKAIVATSSLEMGIDIGYLDEVLLVQSPPSVSSTLQRIGRSGHKVGDVSRAKLYPTHARDLVDAAALMQAVETRDIEPMSPLVCPLDLLAQLIVSHCVASGTRKDAIFATLTRSFPFAELSRKHFDLVVGMLTGRYEDARIRSLQPRISHDRASGKLTVRKGASLALYSSGGTIPDRGYYRLRHVDSGALIGELDEEYVWEAKIGQHLTFGSQQWEIASITHNDVNVRSKGSSSAPIPFYRSEFTNREFHFARLVGNFLETAEHFLNQDKKESLLNLLTERGFETTAASNLIELLERQKQSTGVLPHTNNLIVEWLTSGPGGYVSGASDDQAVLHTSWGGKVNRPIALAMESAWRETFASEPDITCDNYCIAIQLKQGASIESILGFLEPTRFKQRLSESLEKSGFFGARFRECAGRALLLNKNRFDQRVPLWMTRMQSKKLLAAAQTYKDFPILIEALRTCYRDEFDLDAAMQVLHKIQQGSIDIQVVRNKLPSPFATDITFDQIGRYMYADDEPEKKRHSAVAGDLIEGAIRNPELRPLLDENVVNDFELKIQRRFPSYEPIEPLEVEEWVKTRVWIPIDQWFADTEIPANVERIEIRDWTGLVHVENRELIQNNPLQAVANALQFYGPHSRNELNGFIPIDDDDLGPILGELIDSETLTDDVRVADRASFQLCDRENLDALLRYQRLANRPIVEPVSIRKWTSFVSEWQEFGLSKDETDPVLDVVDYLRGYSAPVSFWLRDVWLPRCGSIPAERLSESLASQEICWRGTGREKVCVGQPDDIAFPRKSQTGSKVLRNLFVDPNARYTFSQLYARSQNSLSEFNDLFWESVWSGDISSDNMSSLKSGLERRFKCGSVSTRATPRTFRATRRNSKIRRTIWPGTWYWIESQGTLEDPIGELEDAKERARLLLDRYGFVTREIANRDGGEFRWSLVFPALRIMELAGEVTVGLFFSELSGPQFARQDALRLLTNCRSCEPRWLAAYDPASPCGMGLNWSELPARRSGTFIGVAGDEVLCTSLANGRKLKVYVDADDARLSELFKEFPSTVSDARTLVIDEINDESARSSPYFPLLARTTPAYRDHQRIYVES
ncbi:MAG: DEAD/DEAH box helicase [Gammaproteobacteria bacterium]|nr:DEAD/DEAH box helicase [Gammaproteobacteria bacterium]